MTLASKDKIIKYSLLLFTAILLILNLSMIVINENYLKVTLLVTYSILICIFLIDFIVKDYFKVHFIYGVYLSFLILRTDFTYSLLYVYSFILLLYLLLISTMKFKNKLPYLIYNRVSYKIYTFMLSLVCSFGLVIILNFSAYLYLIVYFIMLITLVLTYNLTYNYLIEKEKKLIFNDFKISNKLIKILENETYLASNTIDYFKFLVSFSYFLNGDYLNSAHYKDNYEMKTSEYLYYYLYEVLFLVKSKDDYGIKQLFKEYESKIKNISNKLNRKYYLKEYKYLQSLINVLYFKKNVEVEVIKTKYNIFKLLENLSEKDIVNQYNNNILYYIFK